MSNKKNTFKSEEVVMSKQPLNFNHPSPKIKKMLNDRMHFLINTKTKKDFIKFCEPYGGVSNVIRGFIDDSLSK